MNAAVAPAMQPLHFDSHAGPCFGWLHRAGGPPRGMGVLLCRPLGYEALCSYPSYLQLAQQLADAGFDVLRFDYHGTGDSAGGDADPDRVAAWLGSITAAAATLRAASGCTQLALFGVRMGATLAARAAQQMGGIDSLVLWAPCVGGRAFLRELQVSAAGRVGAGGTLEALGFLYTPQTQQALEELDLRKIDRLPARRALLIARDDLPGDGPLPAALRAAGVEVAAQPLPGYAAMMREPHEGSTEPATLEAIVAWLAEAAPPLAQPLPGPLPAPPTAFEQARSIAGTLESALAFGPAGKLFGMLAQPFPGGDSDRAQTALLMLNVGGNYRIGPNRLHVRAGRALAAAGWCTLRLDLSGIGDSPGPEITSTAGLYARDATADVQAAIDALAARGCRHFVLMGVCSGSFVAFQTARVEPRVSGQILLNSRLLERHPGPEAGPWQDAMQQYYKSTAFYRRALFDPATYGRLLRGQVDVRGIARRLRVVAQARVARGIARLFAPHGHTEGLLGEFQRLCGRGTDTLMILGEEDDGRDYVEYHFGPLGHRLRGEPRFRMVLQRDSDHTFTRGDSQQEVIATVRDYLERRLAPADPAAAATLAPKRRSRLRRLWT
jgi:alpha-beta hydrolase superfamily lysophospholipase